MSNHELPEKLRNRLIKLAGHYAIDLEQMVTQPGYSCLRLNSWHPKFEQSLDHAQSLGLKTVHWVKTFGLTHCYYLPAHLKSQISNNPLFELGSYYIQGFSSLLAALQLEAKPGEEVLDLTAAPGGKTLILSSQMEQKGRLAAIEYSKPRFFKLQNQLKSHHATWVKTYLMDGRTVGRKCPERFDRILLDAPCSSESRIDLGHPDSWQHWREKKIKSCANTQASLLRAASAALKPGGTLVYSTCTFAPEENEQVLHKHLHTYPGQFDIQTIDTTSVEEIRSASGISAWGKDCFSAELAKSVRITPNAYFSGFFICKLLKKF